MGAATVSVRGNVCCSQCGVDLIRVVWNYGCNRPIKEFFCNNTCKGNWQRHQRELLGFTKEWLYQKYITERLDCNKIAEIVKRDPKRVWEWLRDYEIPTRSRGAEGNPATCFKTGERSRFFGCKHTPETRRRLKEMAIADGRVPFDPAVGSYMKGRSGPDTPNWKGGITPERQAFYSTPEWKAVIKPVWKRDNATCQRCGKRNKRSERFAFDIHHIVGFEVRELRAVLSNLVLLCEECYYWVHSNDNTERVFVG